MTAGNVDYHDVLNKILKELTVKDIKKLKFFFKVESSLDSRSFINTLTAQGFLHEGKVRPLISALELAKLNSLAQELIAYESKCTGLSVAPYGFVGRKLELGKMRHHCYECRPPERKFRSVFLSGLPGVGKTFLAEEFRRLESTDGYFHAMFISCRNVNLTTGLRHLIAERFFINSSDPYFFRTLRKKLNDENYNFNWFITLDNVEDIILKDEENFADFLRQLSSALRGLHRKSNCLLITSRQQLSKATLEDLGPDMLALSIDKMNVKDSLALIALYLGGRNLQMDGRQELAKMCDHHPLTMTLITRRLSCSPLTFADLQEQFERSPFVALSDNLSVLGLSRGIAASLANVFGALDAASQDLLVRCSISPGRLQVSTALQLFLDRSKTYAMRYEVLTRLLESCLVRLSSDSPTRLEIHLLVRRFAEKLCMKDLALRRAREEAQDLLPSLLQSEMFELSEKEFSDPLAFNRDLRAERPNLQACLPHLLDLLILSNEPLPQLARFMRLLPLLIPRRELVPFVRKHWHLAENVSESRRLFFQLHLADALRMEGAHVSAKPKFEMDLKDQSVSSLPEDEKIFLNGLRCRLYGRLLMELKGLALKKAGRYLRNALQLHREPQSERAEIFCDLGRALKAYSDFNRSERIVLLQEAIAAFEKARSIFLLLNPKLACLFDVYLSLGSYKMEVKLALADDNTDFRSVFARSFEHFDAAVEIAKANEEVIWQDPARMAQLRGMQALCHLHAGEHTLAKRYASEALQFSLQAFGRFNNNFIQIAILQGEVLADHPNLPRRKEEALDCFKKALSAAKCLASVGRTVEEQLLKQLRKNLRETCVELKMDPAPYEELLQAIRSNKRSKLKLDKFERDDLEEMSPYLGDVKDSEILEYEDSSDDDGDQKTKDLYRKVKDLMEKNASNLHFLSHKIHQTSMRRIVENLEMAVRCNEMVGDEVARDRIYKEGLKLYLLLDQLNREPARVNSENWKVQEQRKKRFQILVSMIAAVICVIGILLVYVFPVK